VPERPSRRTGAGANEERVRTLERENRALQDRLRDLTEEVTRNDALLRKTQDRELDLLRASSLAQLLDRLIHGLRISYQLDAVALVLNDPQHEIRHLMAGDGFLVDERRELHFVDSIKDVAPRLPDLERPWLGPFSRDDHEKLVFGATRLGSIALIPLWRNEKLDGLLVFCSRDPLRFNRELASDFLAHLGVVAAICIENAVNRARLVRSGLTDFLTGFHNRRYLQSRLREELARAQRARQYLVCLMIDVDYFKRINDQYGHLAGDAVLREVARRVDAEMRTSDTGARFGGDEFAIVLGQSSFEDGERVAQRVLRAVSGQPIKIGAHGSETVTLSIGVAAAAPGHEARDLKHMADRLIAEADAALYRAKSEGRNRVATSENLVK
jgi:diguanylate cyclase (GGDEF)-like protein